MANGVAVLRVAVLAGVGVLAGLSGRTVVAVVRECSGGGGGGALGGWCIESGEGGGHPGDGGGACGYI